MATRTPATAPSDLGPAWEIARLFPNQGAWSEEEYLALDTNRLVELSDGVVEVLEAPTQSHQLIALWIYRQLQSFVMARGLGMVLAVPMRVRLRHGRFREPDVLFMRSENADRRGEQFWNGADLIVEVLSDDRKRALVTKRREYAEAGIPEYWMVDPESRTITVLSLVGEDYVEHGRFGQRDVVTSVLLEGLAVPVDEAFEAVDEGV